jgi:ABC-type Fe3+-hydroxamate transport system substrate-binding protein
MLSRMIQSILLSGLTALLIACGGGGGSTSSTTPSLAGVAAIGTALANATVTLKDSAGKTETTTTDESGNFSFSNVSSFTPPLMLQVKGSVAGVSYVLHSLMTTTPAEGTNTLNVTPATDAIVTQRLIPKPNC